MSNEPWKNATSDAILNVNLVRLSGAYSTRRSFLHSLTSNVFDVNTSGKLFDQVNLTIEKLKRTEIFEEFELHLLQKEKETLEMTVLLKEKDKGYLASDVVVGDNQAELSAGLGIRNIFGGGESVFSQFSFGNYTNAAAKTIAETFVPGYANIKAGILVEGFIKDHSQINAFEEATRAATAYLKAWSHYGIHQIGCSVAERDILPYYDASSAIQTQCGSHFKYSLYHSFVQDERNDPILPTQGHYISLVQELAGFKNTGDLGFIKHELKASYHQPLNRLLTLSTSMRAGLITHSTQKKSVLDRFYLGGPLEVRGFSMGGVNQQELEEASGGEAYCAAGISLISAIPTLEHLPVKLHAFANGGHVIERASEYSSLIENARTSVGLGAIVHHNKFRMEANYCIPLRYSASDKIEPKFQFGFGLYFL
ncbi:surface antigen-domain-containing protein [Sporodiniella umbellata]|nr:surface antigen-domain-containing protein [Sporodiniella umbellata]